MTDSQIFLSHIADNYESLKNRFKSFCQSKHYKWDDDIFGDTILKCADLIEKKGLNDATPQGVENYLFKAFKTNTMRETQYSRNAKRDSNVENVGELFEEWYNSSNITSQEKLLKDLRTDYTALYLLDKVDMEYGSELSHIFTLKYYLGHTYKELQEKYPTIPRLRDKLLTMKKWLQSNVSKQEIQRSFEKKFDSLLYV